MQGVKDFSISKSNINKENDRKIRRDFKKHNWLLIKLKTRLRKAELASKMKQRLQIPRRPVVPVCLPLSFYHKFLRRMEYQEKVVSKRNINKKSRIKVKPLEKSQTTQDLSTKQTKLSNVNDENLKNNTIIINEPNKKDQEQTNKLKILLSSEDGIKIQPGSSPSENPEYLAFTDSQKIDLTKIPLPLQEQLTQTDNVTVIDEQDQELLRVVKNYGFTIDDLERFYQNSIKDNNNQHDLQNLNFIDLDDDDNENKLNQFDENLEISNGDTAVVNTPDAIEHPITNHTNKLPLQNITTDVVQVERRNDRSNSLSPETLQRLSVCSDLNKVILGSFYEAAHLERHDTTAMKNQLSQLSQVLVDEIYKVFLNFNKNNSLKFRTFPEIIELDDSDECEVLPRKRLAVVEPSEDQNTQINSVKKNRTDEISQKQQDKTVKKNVVPQLLPIQTQKLPNQTQKLIIQTKNLPIQTQILPNQIQKLSIQSQKLSIQMQKLPIQTQNLTTRTQKSLIQTQKLPIQTRKLPKQTQKLPIQAQKMPQRTKVLRKFQTQNARKAPSPLLSTPYRNDARLSRDCFLMQYSRRPFENPLYRAQSQRAPLQQQNQHQWFQNSYQSYPYNNYYNQEIPQNTERLRSNNRTFELMMQEQNQNTPYANTSSSCRQSYSYNFQKR